MKDGIKVIVGKRISGVVVAVNKIREPKNQVFLIFDDGTHFELYGTFTGAGGVDKGGVKEASDYAKSMNAEIAVVFAQREVSPRPAARVPSSGGTYATWDEDLLHKIQTDLLNDRTKMLQTGWLRRLTITLTLIAVLLGLGAIMNIVGHGIDRFNGIVLAIGVVAAWFVWRWDQEWRRNSDLLAEISSELDHRRKFSQIHE